MLEINLEIGISLRNLAFKNLKKKSITLEKSPYSCIPFLSVVTIFYFGEYSREKRKLLTTYLTGIYSIRQNDYKWLIFLLFIF